MLQTSETTPIAAPVASEAPTVYLVRVYGNGEAKHTRRRGDQTDWISYNTRWRPGCTLFVNGVCCNAGALTPREIDIISKAIKAEMAAGEVDGLPIDEIQSNVEFFGGRIIHEYQGYQPEAWRKAFSIRQNLPKAE